MPQKVILTHRAIRRLCDNRTNTTKAVAVMTFYVTPTAISGHNSTFHIMAPLDNYP